MSNPSIFPFDFGNSAFIIKILFAIILFLYVIFTFVIFNQVTVMNRVITEKHSSFILGFLAFFIMILAISLFGLTLAIL